MTQPNECGTDPQVCSRPPGRLGIRLPNREIMSRKRRSNSRPYQVQQRHLTRLVGMSFQEPILRGQNSSSCTDLDAGGSHPEASRTVREHRIQLAQSVRAHRVQRLAGRDCHQAEFPGVVSRLLFGTTQSVSVRTLDRCMRHRRDRSGRHRNQSGFGGRAAGGRTYRNKDQRQKRRESDVKD